jgi:hypothetical protein
VAAVEPAPPPQAPPGKPALDRLRDNPGEVHGMPGWSLKHVPDKTVCGGIRIAITKGKAKLEGDRLALSKVYALVFPTDLNFDEKNQKAKEASMKKFNDFVEQLQKVGKTATDEILAGITGTDAAAKAAGAARVGQVALRMAALIGRAPIPKDVRTGEAANEKIEAYCDKLEEVAEPLVARAEEALEACANAGAPAGWYTPLCTAP